MKFIVLRVNYGAPCARPSDSDTSTCCVSAYWGMSIRFNVFAPQSDRVPAGVMHVKPIPKHISGRLDALRRFD